MVNKLFLVGYMSSGKTTVGKKLSERLNYNFFDTDDALPHGKQRAIGVDRDYLYRADKVGYMDIETDILNEYIDFNKQNSVVSTGGSIVKRKKNRDLMKSNGLVIYLRITPETYCKRMETHSNMVYRFDWKNSYHLRKKDAIKNYMERQETIRYGFADIKIDANKSINDICSDIESWLIG